MSHAPTRRPVRITRRQALVAGALGAAALLLPGCGSGDDSAATAATTPEVDPGAFPVTIAHEYGEATIEAPPGRVALLGNEETDIALALGLPMVGMGYWGGAPNGVPVWWDGYTPNPLPPQFEYGADGVNIEEVVATRPDAIIGGYLDKAVHGRLAEVAPTIVPKYEQPLDGRIIDVGRVYGVEDAARELAAEQERVITEAREGRFAALAGKTLFTGFVMTPSEVLNFSDPGTTAFLRSLGMTLAPGTTEVEHFLGVSTERLPLLEADVLVIGYQSEDLKEGMESLSLFQDLEVVKRGGYLGTADTTLYDLLRPAAPLQIRYSLEHAVPQVLTRAEAT